MNVCVYIYIYSMKNTEFYDLSEKSSSGYDFKS